MNKNSLVENRAMNVILTDCSPNWGGQQYRLLREALWLAARGHKVLVICGKRSQLGVRLREYTPQISLHLLNSWGGLHGGQLPFQRIQPHNIAWPGDDDLMSLNV